MKSVYSIVAVLFFRGCALLPLSFLQRLGHGLGILLYHLPNKAKKITRINLQLCFPQLDTEQRERLARSSLKETAKAIFESGPSWIWSPEKLLGLIKKETNTDLLAKAAAEKKGVIVLAPHLGNWEIANYYVANYYKALNLRVAVLYVPPKLPSLDKLVYEGRKRAGVELIPANPRGLIKMRKFLGQEGVTAMLPDQKPKRGLGTYAPFFGQTALTMRLASSMLKKTGAKAVCVYAKRLAIGEGYEFICRDVDPRLYSDDHDESIAGLNRSMEQCIEDIPEQYNWVYKRFTKQPDGRKFYDTK